jgi:hypothetical protein
MKKNTLKYIIAMSLYVDVGALAIVGLLLGFVIPRGMPQGTFLGLHRHQWGDIHLFLAMMLIGLLVLHLWVGWAWIEQTSRRYLGQNYRNAIWMVTGAWFLLVLLAWAVVQF